MGRKFLAVNGNQKFYRLFLDDIKAAHKKIRREVPRIPGFRNNKDDESATTCGLENSAEL